MSDTQQKLEEKVIRIFDNIDTNGNGSLEKEELLADMRKKADDEEQAQKFLDDTIRMFDTNGDG